MPIVRLLAKIALAVLLCVVVAIALLIVAIRIDHRRATVLPPPTGPFAVGRTSLVFTDPAQQQLLAPEPAPRTVLAWVWYPAAPGPSDRTAEYFPTPWRDAMNHKGGSFFFRDLARVHANSLEDAALSPAQATYPIVFMRAGLAAETLSYSALAEDLASHGYVVVGFDAPWRTTAVVLPNDRVIERTPANNADLVAGPQQKQLAIHLLDAWVSDMGFALDHLQLLNASDSSGRFRGRLDLSRVGVFGHSLGGATALEFCHHDPRCKAAIDIDGAPLGAVVTQGISQPILLLLTDHSREPKTETAPIEADLHSVCDRLSPDRCLWLSLRGSNHFGFVDLTPLPVRIAHTLGIVKLDGVRQVAITREVIDTFFDADLKGAPASTLQTMTARHPELSNNR